MLLEVSTPPKCSKRRKIDWGNRDNLPLDSLKKCADEIGTAAVTLEQKAPNEAESPNAARDSSGDSVEAKQEQRLASLLQHMPPKSRDALLPVLRRWGAERLQEVLALRGFLGDGPNGDRPSSLRRRCAGALHVWGPAGVGKTDVVSGYLKDLGFRYVWLNCYCILSQADLHRKLAVAVTCLAQEVAGSGQLESLDSNLPQQLRAIDRLEVALRAPLAELSRLKCDQVIIVVDHVEELVRRLGLPALELLLGLPEILSSGHMLAVLTISRLPLRSMGLLSTREPPDVPFQPYCEEDSLKLLLRRLSHLAERETLNFVVYGLKKMAVPFVGWNLDLLLEVGEVILHALPAGQKHSASQLQTLIEEACKRRVGFVHKDESGKLVDAADATMRSMTKVEMRLVLAAYLASRVSKQDDRQLFLGNGGKRRRFNVVRQKDPGFPAHVQAPAAVAMPRLLAVYHRLALQPRLLGTQLFHALTNVKEAGLIRMLGERNFKLDRDLKVICRAELPLAQACARQLKVDLTEYLCK